jgi:hypothetical protein
MNYTSKSRVLYYLNTIILANCGTPRTYVWIVLLLFSLISSNNELSKMAVIDGFSVNFSWYSARIYKKKLLALMIFDNTQSLSTSLVILISKFIKSCETNPYNLLHTGDMIIHLLPFLYLIKFKLNLNEITYQDLIYSFINNRLWFKIATQNYYPGIKKNKSSQIINNLYKFSPPLKKDVFRIAYLFETVSYITIIFLIKYKILFIEFF